MLDVGIAGGVTAKFQERDHVVSCSREVLKPKEFTEVDPAANPRNDVLAGAFRVPVRLSLYILMSQSG